jgi:methionyl-tRNA formyltransferase
MGRFLSQPRKQIRLEREVRQLSNRIRFVPDIHAADVLDRVRALAPDLGLVYGSPILRSELFEIPSLGTLGIHHGMLPEFRGKKTTFWAMYNGEAAAGVTIQRINTGLDTGAVVNQGQVPIGRSSYRAVWRRLEALGLDLYIQSVLAVKSGIAEYRELEYGNSRVFKDPSARDILAFWYRQVRKRLRWVPRHRLHFQ